MKMLKYLFYRLFRIKKYKERKLFILEASIGLDEEDDI